MEKRPILVGGRAIKCPIINVVGPGCLAPNQSNVAQSLKGGRFSSARPIFNLSVLAMSSAHAVGVISN